MCVMQHYVFSFQAPANPEHDSGETQAGFYFERVREKQSSGTKDTNRLQDEWISSTHPSLMCRNA